MEAKKEAATPAGDEKRLDQAAPGPSGSPQHTIGNSIIFDTNHGSYVYDVDTQNYYARLPAGNWVLLHQTPQTTLSKADAKIYLKNFPTMATAIETFDKKFGIKPSSNPAIKYETIIYNAMNDSILVKRDKSTTGLVQYYMDKLPMPYVKSLSLLAQFLRPKLDATHQCLQLQTYGQLLYCPECAIYSVPVTVSYTPAAPAASQPSAPTAPTTVSARATVRVGKLTLPKAMVDTLARFYCADPKTGKFNVDATFTTLNSLLQLADLNMIKLPKDLLLGWLFRDSFFVVKYDGKVVSWAENFKVGKEGGFSSGDAVTLLRLGLAIGTLGMIS